MASFCCCFINRKLNFGDGQMLKAQETKIPHGRIFMY